jgi:hypothetical protein
MRCSLTLIAGVTLTAVTLASCGDTPTAPSTLTSSATGPTIQFSHEDNDNGSSGNGVGGAALVDANFLSFAAGVHRMFVALGILAELRGDLFPVKAFGLELIDEGRTALSHLGETAGVGQRIVLTSAHQQLHDRLEALAGSAFDRAFVEAIMRELQTAIREYGQQNGSLSSSSLRSHASERVSNMSTILARARDLAGRVGACVPDNGNGNGRCPSNGNGGS